MLIKLFPETKYEFDLSPTNIGRLNDFKNETKLSSSLSSFKTDRKFIGNFNQNYFKLISSVIGKGAFCVFNGYIDEENKNGTIKIKVNADFKVLIQIWLVFVFAAIIYIILKEGIAKAISALLLLTILISVIRYILIARLFNSVSQKGLNELTNILGIINLREVEILEEV